LHLCRVLRFVVIGAKPVNPFVERADPSFQKNLTLKVVNLLKGAFGNGSIVRHDHQVAILVLEKELEHFFSINIFSDKRQHSNNYLGPAVPPRTDDSHLSVQIWILEYSRLAGYQIETTSSVYWDW